MEGGPPGFPRGFTCPAVLWILTGVFGFRLRGSHPLWPAFPYRSANLIHCCVSPQPRWINPPVCPLPRSLATTDGISVDFSSSPYLDVSVQACHVLLRLLMPRHSPCALISLTSSGQAPYPSLPARAERSLAPLPLLSGAETFVSSPVSQGFGSGYRSRSCRTPIISCSLDHELCRLHRSCQFWLIVITLLNSFRHSIVPQHLLLIALCCLLFISESTLFSFQGAFLWSH